MYSIVVCFCNLQDVACNRTGVYWYDLLNEMYTTTTTTLVLKMYLFILLIGMFNVVSVSGVGRSYQKCTHWGFGVFHSRYRGTGAKPIYNLESLIYR